MNTSCLIGGTGFVGTTLKKQHPFTAEYRSINIQNIRAQHYDQIICAAAPAQKWLANKAPEADRQNIEYLMAQLKTVSCDRFILISTVDVFNLPVGVDENTVIDESYLQPYGLHRRQLEKFVAHQFPKHLIVRLPGLVGPGLRKNIIFDFLNNNNVETIDSRAIFQFYPMVNLWWDIETALKAELQLVHLTAQPISVAEVAELGFRIPFSQQQPGNPPIYDFRTRYSNLFGVTGAYQYDRQDLLLAIRAYAQSEPQTKKG